MNKNTDTRTKLLEITSMLIRRKGYFGTGVTEILKLTGAPKGSMYHHFPGGKDELVKEALLHSAKKIQKEIREKTQNCTNRRERFTALIEYYIDTLEKSNFANSCPIATVALEIATEQHDLAEVSKNIFTNLAGYLATYFDNADNKEALYKGEVALSLIEGGLLLAKVKRDSSPLRTVEKELLKL